MLDHCELQEMRSAGAYYSWTNKVVRSRIDRAFIDSLWHETFDFTQVTYMANGLSDHTPLLAKPDDTGLQAKEKEQRERYIATLTSILSLLQQQSKMKWIQYGDEGSRLLFAKAKQRKLATYIYTIKDDSGNRVEGFEPVGQGCTDPSRWDWQGAPTYKLGKGYKWQLKVQRHVNWTKLVWARTVIPRHSFIAWILINHRLPTRSRLSKFQHLSTTLCPLCNAVEEDENHLFLTCHYAQTLWTSLQQWWPVPLATDINSLVHKIRRIKAAPAKNRITYAIFTAIVYYIWRAQN
ncbi:hypothetical protein Cgig2_014910 [Carnegiea gigantea]|uniref:Reverse transcriptase zinc-binding domain-containing protein n=1 Tax=Carnegiea gigantea TaxID=171969 RepID=A0A9Q1GIT5_9CARY|nr:hypothetical protein Cgig2_014910 [Carnegiea gigantea]